MSFHGFSFNYFKELFDSFSGKMLKVPVSMLVGKCSVDGVSSPACGLWGWYWNENSPNSHDPSYGDYVSRWSAYDD